MQKIRFLKYLLGKNHCNINEITEKYLLCIDYFKTRSFKKFYAGWNHILYFFFQTMVCIMWLTALIFSPSKNVKKYCHKVIRSFSRDAVSVCIWCDLRTNFFIFLGEFPIGFITFIFVFMHYGLQSAIWNESNWILMG